MYDGTKNYLSDLTCIEVSAGIGGDGIQVIKALLNIRTITVGDLSGLPCDELVLFCNYNITPRWILT